jgi:hypothetical protein
LLDGLGRALRDRYRREALAFLADHIPPLSAVAARIGRLTGKPADWAGRVFAHLRLELLDEETTQETPYYRSVHRVHYAWPRPSGVLLTGEALFSERDLDGLIDRALQPSGADASAQTLASTEKGPEAAPSGPGSDRRESAAADLAANAA